MRNNILQEAFSRRINTFCSRRYINFTCKRTKISSLCSSSLEVAKQFVDHISKGNIRELIAFFNDNILIIGDGGGKAPAITKPLLGKKQVAQFFSNSWAIKTLHLFFPLLRFYHSLQLLFI